MSVRKSQPSIMDVRYDDFIARHIFTAKLRLVILLGYWALFALFFPGILTLDQPVLLIISVTFVLTTIAYYFILKGVYLTFFVILEVIADVAAQTVLVYLSGGFKSNFYTIYIIYAAAGGVFYNYKIAILIAFVSLLFYSGLLFSINMGLIEQYSYPLWEKAYLDSLGPAKNIVLLIGAYLVVIYGVKIVNYFSEIHDRAMEKRNKELESLNQLSAVTRTEVTVDRVIVEILDNVCRGMELPEACILMSESGSTRLRIRMREKTVFSEMVREVLGVSPNEYYLPKPDEKNILYRAMKEKRTLMTGDLGEVVVGLQPVVDLGNAEIIQKEMNLKRFIIAPMISEGKILGALVSVSHEDWLEEETIRLFEGFADQAALALDNILLITELKDKNIELERVSRVKSEFLATMSHELRTPLTAIIGFSEILLEKTIGDLNKEQVDSLKEILANGHHLLQMINGLLDFAKIEAGKMDLQVSPVVMEDLVVRVQRMMQSLVQKKNLHLNVECPGQMPFFHGDEKKIQQIFVNLLSNAIKFTPEGGKIDVKIVYEKEGLLNVIRGKVSDTGVGIPESQIVSVFEPFHQVDSSYTREYQGTGLGLALVKQFVNMHGGQINVSSTVGRGSTFEFTLYDQPDLTS